MTKLFRLLCGLAPVLLLTACGADGSALAKNPAPTSPGQQSWSVVSLGDSFTATQNSSGRSYLDLFQKSLQDKVGRKIDLEDLSNDANTTSTRTTPTLAMSA